MSRETWAQLRARHDTERAMFRLDFPLEAGLEEAAEAFFAVSRELQDVQARYSAAQKHLHEAQNAVDAAPRAQEQADMQETTDDVHPSAGSEEV